MHITVDRRENGFIVVELPSGETISVPEVLLPDAAEGDIFLIEKDMEEADRRRQRIEEKMNRLFVD